MRPDKLLPLLEASSDELPERGWLLETARAGVEHEQLPRLLRAERASSGRAHCRSCHELIAKGEWRLALQTFEEGRATPLGTIHASCAEAYFGTADVLDRAQRLTPSLSADDLNDLKAALAEQRPRVDETQASDEDDASKVGTGNA
jgi:cytochrome c553